MKNTAANTVINKAAVVKAIAERTDLTQKQALTALDTLVDVIEDAMKAGNKVNIPGFGSWEVNTRAERIGRNPATGEDMIIPETKMIKYKTSKKLKDAARSSK